MTVIKKLLTGMVLCILNYPLAAHERTHTATYLGNEAVLVKGTNHKILFDPFFHQNFGQYQLVPQPIKAAMMGGTAPYDNIDAIVISHAHDDHFAADEVLAYLRAFPSTKLVAPQQAVDKLAELDNAQSIMPQVFGVKLALGDNPVQLLIDGITFAAVRIPHAGWPGRADVENLVFRVGLESGFTVMHMGDADPNDDHFLPYRAFWQQRISDTAFPPFWFFSSAEGNDILEIIINAKAHIGVHVPTVVPNSLRKSNKDYFSMPGEKRAISHQHH